MIEFSVFLQLHILMSNNGHGEVSDRLTIFVI